MTPAMLTRDSFNKQSLGIPLNTSVKEVSFANFSVFTDHFAPIPTSLPSLLHLLEASAVEEDHAGRIRISQCAVPPSALCSVPRGWNIQLINLSRLGY
jgi:hypothetical protein